MWFYYFYEIFAIIYTIFSLVFLVYAFFKITSYLFRQIKSHSRFLGKGSITAYKNYNELISICGNIIDNCKTKSLYSCKEDLMKRLKRYFKVNWDDLRTPIHSKQELQRIAYASITNNSFDMLASGKYHIHYGVLDPTSCASHMMSVYISCLDYAISIGELTETEKQEQIKLLNQLISEVG